VGNLPQSPDQIHIKLFARVKEGPEHHSSPFLVHLSDESVDVLFPVAKITALDEMSELAWTETASWVGQLEWPQEVGCLLEVGANSEDLKVGLAIVRVSQDKYNIPRESSLRCKRCRIGLGTPR
jgi:hypothetical protein